MERQKRDQDQAPPTLARKTGTAERKDLLNQDTQAALSEVTTLNLAWCVTFQGPKHYGLSSRARSVTILCSLISLGSTVSSGLQDQ